MQKKYIQFTLFIVLALVSFQKTTAQCFQIESILVDACGPQEGLNEMVRFKIGTTAQNTSNMTVSWPNNAWRGLVQNATTASKTAALNADIVSAGGCGRLIQPTGGVLPANADVILVTSFNLDTALNSFGALTQNIYILYQDNATTTGGHFANSGTGLRTLTVSFGACSDTVTYDRALLVDTNGNTTAADGAIVLFTSNNVASYINNGCSAPVPPFTVDAGPVSVNACPGATITLSGTAQGHASVNWSAPSGSFSSAGNLSTSYTVSPTASGTIPVRLTATNACGSTINDVINVTIINSVTPTFTPRSPICSGGTLAPLPTTSTNGITGTWSPALNNTATTIYTFTPGAGQCAVSTTLTITVNSGITPTFAAVNPICSGGTLAPLPTTSTNGITGTWSPALNNTATTIYTFTPGAGQCAVSTTLTITVNLGITPTFAAVNSICSGGTLGSLPTTSTNGITGTWSPALNNTATTIYTFTPGAGQCAVSTTLTITVNLGITPTFAAVNSICSGGTLAPLPTTSTNGITGTWSPVLNNTATTVYTFTPGAGQCGGSVTISIVVSDIVFEIEGDCVNGNYMLQAIPASGSFDAAVFEWRDELGQLVSNDNNLNVTQLLASVNHPQFPITYELTVENSQGCSRIRTKTVYGVFCKIQKGISPNNDGNNDVFDLTGMGVAELTLFNRYGVVVNSFKNYTDQWGGQSDKGDLLPDGTYYYIIRKSNDETLTGWIYILRER